MATVSYGLVCDGLLTRNLEAVGNWQGPQQEGAMSGALTGKPTLDFEMHQGCYRRLTITVAGDDGAPVDLIGYRVDWSVSGADLEKTSAVGSVVILDQIGNKGKCQIDISTLDTVEVPPGRYFHQVLVTDPDGNPDVVLEGWLTLKINITDD